MKNQFVWTLWKLHSDPAPVVIRNTDTSISYTIKITFVIGTILQFYIHSFWFNKHSESDQWIAGGTASAQSRYTMSILSVSSCNYFIICQQSTIIYIIHLLWFSAPFRTWRRYLLSQILLFQVCWCSALFEILGKVWDLLLEDIVHQPVPVNGVLGFEAYRGCQRCAWKANIIDTSEWNSHPHNSSDFIYGK